MLSMRSRSSACRGFLKLVEIHADQIDLWNVMSLQGGTMFRIFANGEDAAGDLRMHGLDAAIQHLRKSGNVRDLSHRDGSIA